MSIDKVIREFEKIKASPGSLADKSAQLKKYYGRVDSKGRYEIRSCLLQCLDSGKKHDESYGIFVGAAIGLENVWPKAIANLRNESLPTVAASINLAALAELNYFPEKTAETLQKWIPRLPHQALIALSKINYESALEQYASHQRKLEDPLDTLALIFANRVSKIGYEKFLEEQSSYAKKYKIDEKIVNHIAKDALRKKMGIKY